MTPSLSNLTPTLSTVTPSLSQMKPQIAQISGYRLATEELTTEAAEDTDFGLLYLIFNLVYYSMG
jgi:hypothetical protein